MIHEDLIDDPGSITLLTLQTGEKCSYTGERIEPGTAAVLAGDPEQETRVVRFSLTAISDVQDALTGADFERRDHIALTSPLETVPGGQLDWVNGHCTVCADEIHGGEDWVGHVPQTGVTGTGPIGEAYLHGTCIPEFTAALDRAWDHAPAVLSELV